jgi:D-threonate/D-erythronate kinase
LDALVRAALTVQEMRRWLWCGSGGLAGALSRSLEMHRSPSAPRLPLPFLGVIGSPDPVAQAQLRAAGRCGLPVLTLPRNEDSVQDLVLRKAAQRHLRRGVGCFLAAPAPRSGKDNNEAYGRRLAEYAVSLTRTAGPASLILSGGDTARAVCRRLGLGGLRVSGEIAAGVPVSRPLGAADLGTLMVVTKAGSFGSRGLWCTLIKDRHPAEGTTNVP